MKLIRITVCSLLAAGLTSCLGTSTHTVGWGDTGSFTLASREAALRAEEEQLKALRTALVKEGYKSASDSEWIVNPNPSHGGGYAAHRKRILESGSASRRERVEIKSEVVEYPEPHEYELKFHIHYSISSRRAGMTRNQAGEPEDPELTELEATHKEGRPFVQRILDILLGNANKTPGHVR